MNLKTRNTLPAVGTLTGMALISATLALPAHAAPTASIAGTVTSAENTDGVGVGAFRRNSEGNYEFAAFAPVADGEYLIDGLEAGSYKIGYIDTNGALATEYYGGAPTLPISPPLTVDEGAQLLGVNGVLERGASITGTVSSEAPLTDTDVTAYIQYGGSWHGVTGAYIDADGNYDLTQLPAGTYKVEFEDYSGATVKEYWNDRRTMDEAEAIEVSSGESRLSINAALTANGPQDPVTPQPPVDPPVPPMPPTPPIEPPTVPQEPQPENPDVPETKEHLLKAAASLETFGKAKVGKKVRVRTGRAGEVNYSFSWRANGKKVGHTFTYYKIPTKLMGKRLTVKVKLYNEAGSIKRTLKFGKVKR